LIGDVEFKVVWDRPEHWFCSKCGCSFLACPDSVRRFRRERSDSYICERCFDKTAAIQAESDDGSSQDSDPDRGVAAEWIDGSVREVARPFLGRTPMTLDRRKRKSACFAASASFVSDLWLQESSDISIEDICSVGSRVVIMGLEEEAELNGKFGRVTKVERAAHKYTVAFEGGGCQRLPHENVQPVDAKKIKSGSQVVIVGLVKLPELNGLTGMVGRRDLDAGRCTILLDTPIADGRDRVKVKFDNMRLMRPGESNTKSPLSCWMLLLPTVAGSRCLSDRR